ncbi:hypothetical protein [Streptomyces sp. TRM68416]|uniref:hypothetical protein n=1 Tax=Streptomyces sp. TRM68416 TaxID=2758412 RepID=UPI0016620AE6|nr:hypothetical protein [Streptomyces sp. TRM68416]MBD0839078.1 hypothetical protein [Streptomyces sp. TRM68416]
MNRSTAHTDVPPVRRWPKALLHGWVGGSLGLLLMMVVIGGLRLSGGGAMFLVLYCAAILPPALVSYRLQPRPARAAPTALPPEDTERAITEYGELLHAHPYSPGHTADTRELADYDTALDAYEQAKRSAPAQVPAILARGREALNRLGATGPDSLDHRLGTTAPDTTGVTWSQGRGTMKLRLPWPTPGAPALLVVETDVERHLTVHSRSGRGSRRQPLLDGLLGPHGAQVGVPAQDGDSLYVEVGADGPWRLALRPLGAVRKLADGGVLHGRGTETVLRRGTAGAVEFEHSGDTEFVVRRLTGTFRPTRLLAQGRGKARLTVPAQRCCVLHVETTGSWKLRTPTA